MAKIPHLVTPEVVAAETGIPLRQVMGRLRAAGCAPVAMAGVIPVYERRAIDAVKALSAVTDSASDAQMGARDE
jgi:hypothetical protein